MQAVRGACGVDDGEPTSPWRAAAGAIGKRVQKRQFRPTVTGCALLFSPVISLAAFDRKSDSRRACVFLASAQLAPSPSSEPAAARVSACIFNSASALSLDRLNLPRPTQPASGASDEFKRYPPVRWKPVSVLEQESTPSPPSCLIRDWPMAAPAEVLPMQATSWLSCSFLPREVGGRYCRLTGHL